MNPPILRLELESMRFAILRAFTEMSVQTDSMVKEAIARFCTPENLQRLINDQVAGVLNTAIREEIEHFYRHGDGRSFLREAINNKLKFGQERQ